MGNNRRDIIVATATIRIGAQIHVSFGCTQVGKIEHIVITGLNQVGFIVSSEYKVDACISRHKKPEGRSASIRLFQVLSK